MKRIITLTTDFGTKDPFVAQMKGVIYSLNSECIIVDITHEIESFNPEYVSFLLESTVKFFPLNSIHIAVVDPDVGSDRRGLIVKTKKHYFVGPDNGLFSEILRENQKEVLIYEIENRNYLSSSISRTFHGRDIFAPVAGHLSLGVVPEKIGKLISDPFIYKEEAIKITENSIEGRVVTIDHFGNIITNLKFKTIEPFLKGSFCVESGSHSVEVLTESYKEGKKSLNAIINSSQLLELFSFKENASKLHGIKRDDAVRILKKKN